MNAIILTAVWGVVMMLGGAFFKNRRLPHLLAIAGMLLVLFANAYELWMRDPLPLFAGIEVNDMLHFTSFSLSFLTVIFFCTLLYFLLSGRDMEKVGRHVSEYYALIFFVLCGISLVATFNTLLILFLGIEIISIPLYILTSSDKRNLKSNEAGLKYFLMGAFSTGIMLMGIALLYGGSSTASFYINNLGIGTTAVSPMIITGMILLLVAMAFKVSAAPFHFWTPDVYDGAPTVFTSFMATMVKVAGFFAFVRLFESSFGMMHAQWQKLVVVLIVATLLIGNLTAVFQQSVKRMLAYSSIAQAGFMLFALFALNDTAKEGLVLYAAAYSLATIGLFAVLIKMKDYTIEGFNGLGKQQPLLALAVTIFLLSLTGIPLTAGFQAKFFMLVAAVQNGHQFWLVILAVLCAAISAYYYFRVIQAMYFRESTENATTEWDISAGFKALLLFTALLIVLIGAYPDLVVDWLHYG
ncbi:MAG: NADH-quinone oxidoreductase subunit N [Ferruginibacter sp.]